MTDHVVSLRRRLAAFLRRLAQRVDVPMPPPPMARFRVMRVSEGVRHFAYSGNDGAAARKTWEALVADRSLTGTMRFYDGDACRGEVVR